MKHRIMVVEDDEGHRVALERHLSRSGYEVLACESAEQALSRLSAFKPELVISDIRMGGMSGFDLLRTLKERSPDMRVILATAHDDMQTAIDAMKNGAVDFLMKPLDLDDIDEAVQNALPHSGKSSGGEPSEPLVPSNRLIGRDPQMVQIYKTVGKVAATEAPVLILGETGTGKELLARTLHENSRRSAGPFVSVNCAALPDPLLESELFGHLKGSFTGATADRRGRFELATDGTIFLDEIGDTSPSFQTKLLRVLQEKEFYPVGGETPRRTQARVVAATHRNLDDMTRIGAFRQDLLFRLRVVELELPPLRDRRGDIPRLARHLAVKAAINIGRPAPVIADTAMAALLNYDWPGNVRELENAIMRAVVMSQDAVLRADQFEDLTSPMLDLPPELEDGMKTLADMERAYVQHVLAQTGGHKSKTAEILRVSRGRLDRIIEKYGLTAEFS
ncbi:MAG TPA: sigma-54 dependent transcriptional regulator [Longimicrobiales bacterium]|nr:sigma-54 dependent transcriptional regulator [Longimicrobiales bacterium]